MLRSVYLKTLRERWLGALIGVAALFLIAWGGLWAYAGLGDATSDLFAQMPDAYLSLLGVPADAGPAALMLSNLFNFIAPFVIAGIGISMGAAAIAGEESAGTMNVLGTMPRSRGRLLASKALAMVTIVVVAAAATGVSFVLATWLADTGVGSLDLVAAAVHMAVVCVAFAMLALAIGAATGNRGAASGASVGLLVVSFLTAGLLPLFEGLSEWARVSPWYWISGPQPMVNGIDWLPLIVVLAVTLALGVAAWWGLRRRDLNSGAVRAPILERLRNEPRLAALLDVLAGSGSTRGVTWHTVSQLRPVLLIAAGGMFAMALVLGPMYNALSGDIGEVVNSMPDSILAMVGYADFSTAEGWYFGELGTIVAPVAVGVVAISAGAVLVAEEKRRTANVLLSLPVSRTYVAVRMAGAIVVGSVIVGAAYAAGVAAGNAIGGLGMDYGNIVAFGLLFAGLGAVLGAAAFLGGALSGRHSVAVGAGAGVAILGWGIQSFLPINPDLVDWARVSPFYYALDGNPLEIGMTWSHLVVLISVAVVLVVAGIAAYRARDLRG